MGRRSCSAMSSRVWSEITLACRAKVGRDNFSRACRVPRATGSLARRHKPRRGKVMGLMVEWLRVEAVRVKRLRVRLEGQGLRVEA